ncbi:MAG: hypothetical protein RMJ57_06710, partial [Bacteroidia bacterium]|nr:hypothetical protein [Bacteroidia bacterium]
SLADYAPVQAGNTTAPPHYYVAFQRHGNGGGELYWAVVDTALYRIPPNTYSSTEYPRLIVCRALVRRPTVLNRVVLESTEVHSLQLSGIAIEPRVGGSLNVPQPYLYLSGTLEGTSWKLKGFSGGGSVSLQGAPIGQGTAAFVLGLHWNGSSWRFLGYKPFFSLAQDPSTQNLVQSAGMAKHPTLPQLYLYGWGRDSLVVEPRWASGNADTVRLSTSPFHSARLWIGRLDLYTVSANPLSISGLRCAPDTMLSDWPIQITGTWAPSINRDLVWVPEASVRSYQAKQRWASILANPIGPASALQEGVRVGSFSLLAPGRLPPGRYFLALRSPVMGNRFADIGGDTLWIEVLGTTTPQLQRAGALRWQRMVVRYAGGEPSLPSASAATQPFYRRERSFEDIAAMVYFPWEGWLGGREVLYILERLPDTYWLYRLDFGTGFITPLRSWPASGAGSRGDFIFGDRVRGALWSVSGNRIFWRLDSVDAGRDDSLLLYRADASFSSTGVTGTGGYPLNSRQMWTSVVRLPTCTQNGDIVFFASHRISASGFRWVIARISPERDSVYLVAGGGNSSCPQDGVGSAVTLSGDFSHITSRGDTLYWVERAGVGCANARRLLRKAWPTTSDRRIYEVRTIDTLDGNANSDYFNLEYSDVPSSGLYMNATRSSSSFMLWYDLTTRRRDTLLMCAQGLCCKYGLSDYVQPPAPHSPYVVLRSGVVLFGGGGGREIRALLPLHLSTQADTLRAEETIQAVSQGSVGQDTLYLSSPSDSTWLQVSVCGGGVGKSFWYGRYLVPSLSVRIIAPDSVCEGMIFHSFLQYLPSFWVEEDCRVGGSLFGWGSQMGLLSLRMSGNEVGRWYARAAGYDTLRLRLTRERWRWLISQVDSTRPIRIRRGHRVRMQVALEGPWVATPTHPRWMQAHPQLNRLFFARYNSGNSGIASDSLWRLLRILSDSLMQTWNLLLVEPSSCPSDLSSNDWMCFPNWSQISYIELRDATTHQRVDSAYAVVDTIGRMYLYRAPLGGGIPLLSNDTLSFCYCDTTTPKYFVIRTPNHLPLYTKVISLPARGAGSADFLDLTDPSSLEGIPNLHYKLLTDSTVSPVRERAAAWAGNCADVYNGFVPGPHYDAGVVNAADWEFLMPRNGITTGYSWADLNSDGVVNAADAVLLIRNQNELRQSVGP